MKYVLMIYSNPASRQHPRLNQFVELCQEISESGELIGQGTPLADPINARTVRLVDNELTASDGPFLESKEHLAGFFIVDCESVERATEIASRFPDARLCAVEVRPIMDMSGPEM